MLPLLPLALAGGSALSSGLGALAARKATKTAKDRLAGVAVPSAQDLRARYQRSSSAGAFVPTQDQATPQGRSELEGFTADPGLRRAQLQALADLQRVGAEGGLTAEDRATAEAIRREGAAQERGQREAIGATARRRGVTGSGLDLVAAQVAQQGAAERAAQADTELAGLASARRQQALSQVGALAGDLRGQDFSEAARRAEAQDAINRFNTSNLAGVRAANISQLNDAALRNLDLEQRLRDEDAELANREEDVRRNALLQRYNLLLGRANALGGFDQQLGQQTQQFFGGLSGLFNSFNPGLPGAGGK